MNRNNTSQKKLAVSWVAVCLITAGISFAAGWWTAMPTPTPQQNTAKDTPQESYQTVIEPRIVKPEISRTQNPSRRWTNHLLDCGYGAIEIKPIKDQLQTAIASAMAAGRVWQAALYFRQLNGYDWVGINEDDLYTPASLMKVPVLISVLRQADLQPGFLDKSILYQKPVQKIYDQQFATHNPEVGKSFSIRELLVLMIKYSSNEASRLLIENTDKAVIAAVYRDLEIPLPGTVPSENFLSVYKYARLFRILYNASYLSDANSEFALSLLSITTFDQGLVSGIPDTIPVSHKFGEREMPEYKQLHDCGIVYVPNDPYLLCIMTRGNDLEKMAGTIAEISKIVYATVTNRIPPSIN